jgi:hypothetical protein
VELLRAGKADAVAALKTFLFPASDTILGSRVLDGRTYVEEIGRGFPKAEMPSKQSTCANLSTMQSLAAS